ncbi:MAG: PHP domain-containing protein [Eubacteriales bacterium]
MKVYYDLHIHSALSPCADDGMRPRDIANMAKLKGLDIISVVDHVCGMNMAVAKEEAEAAGLLFLPGIEVTASNGTHLLCYFKTLESALAFSKIIYDSLPDGPSTAAYFGNQLVFNRDDEVCGEAVKPLAACTPYSIWEIIGLTMEYFGVVVPAHINREYQGILHTEGPTAMKEYNFTAVEVKTHLPIDYGIIKGQKIIDNSDAHILYRINEATNWMTLTEKSVEAVFEYLAT